MERLSDVSQDMVLVGELDDEAEVVAYVRRRVEVFLRRTKGLQLEGDPRVGVVAQALSSYFDPRLDASEKLKVAGAGRMVFKMLSELDAVGCSSSSPESLLAEGFAARRGGSG